MKTAYFKLALLGGLILITFNLASPALAEVVKVNLLQINDIYEITPVEGGRWGGLARLATLRQQLLAENPRTYTVLAGDLLSPSALGTAKVNGEPLAGRQIVDLMNHLGLDYATFGNHEFDLSEQQFYQRLKESQFQWFSGNVTDAKGRPLPNVPPYVILEVTGDQGEVVKIGMIGLTLKSNPSQYVQYRDPITVAKEQVNFLQDQVDMIVAITHLSIDQDRHLANEVPAIDLILGGHEHENIQQWRVVNRDPGAGTCSRNITPIFKADANARTVYIHTLIYDTTTDCLRIESRIQPITPAIPDDPSITKIVEEWLEKGFEGFRLAGFEPTEVVATIDESLDGLEASVRNYPTNLTDLIARSMLQEADQAQLAIFNSGGIRIDDQIPPGEVTQYDIIRILPFGGKILTVKMSGELLQRVLDQGRKNQGMGGYLQTANVTWDEGAGTWMIQNQPLVLNATYHVAINDFLVSGKEQNLGFLALGVPGIELVKTGGDLRFAVIEELRRR